MAKTVLSWILVGVFAWLWRYVFDMDFFTNDVAFIGWSLLTVALMRTAKA